MPNLTPAELERRLSSFQKIARKKHAFKQVERQTGIRLEKQSHKNLMDLYKRLRQGTDLPSNRYENISKEKKPNEALSPAEVDFFKQLLNSPFILNHVPSNAGDILKNNATLYSSNQLEKRKIHAHSHTAADYGAKHFVFFFLWISRKNKYSKFRGFSRFLP